MLCGLAKDRQTPHARAGKMQSPVWGEDQVASDRFLDNPSSALPSSDVNVNVSPSYHGPHSLYGKNSNRKSFQGVNVHGAEPGFALHGSR
jgi:hypothetical protein